MAAGDITHVEVPGTLLPGALAIAYTVPVNNVLIALEIVALNLDAANPYGLEVQLIAAGQAAADQYKIADDQAAGGTLLQPGERRAINANPMCAAGTVIQWCESTGNANKIAARAGMTLKALA